MSLVKQLMIRAGADFSQMRTELIKARKDLDKFRSGINRTVAGIGAALAGIGAGITLGSAMADAIKFEALMGTLSQTLGRSANDFVKWQQTVGDAMGFSKLEAVEMANNYSLRLKSIAKDEQDLLKKTTDLIKAAAIIRSKTGMSSIEISDRMRSAMNQEADGADELGINVRVAAIQQSNAYKMLANNAPWDSMNEGLKKTILYHHILESTTNNFGTEIAQNTALLKGGFVAALGDTRLALGQAFLPILNIALPLLTRMARAAEVAFIKVAALMRALFPKSNIAAGAATTAVVDSQESSVSGLGDAYKDAAGAADKAGKAAKKAAGSVAGFDEVNILADPKEAAGGGDEPIGGVDIPAFDPGSFADPTLQVTEQVGAMVEKIKGLLSKVNFNPLIEAFGKLKTAVAPITATLFDGLKWLWDNILVPLGKWTIEDFLPAFLTAIAGALTVLNPLLTTFQTLGIWLWDNFLKQIATWTGAAIVASLNSLGGALTTIGNWMSKNQSVVTVTTAAVGLFFGAWKVVELMAFIQTSGGLALAFAKITTAIKAATVAKIANAYQTVVLSAMYAKDLVVAIAASTVELIKSAARWVASTAAMVANKIALGASTVAQWSMTAATIAWNVAAGIGAAVTTAFGVAMAILTSPITLVIAAIALLVVGIILLVKHWDEVKIVAGKVWDWIKGVWSVAYKWLDDKVIKPIADGFSGMWDGVTEAVGNAWETVKSVWGNVTQWFSSNVLVPFANMHLAIFNGIIDGVNWVIRALNKIKFDIPDWVPGIGGKSFAINLEEVPKLPKFQTKLARGGIFDTKTDIGNNRVAGESGSELVMPLENTGFVEKVASALGTAVMTAMQMSQGQNQGKGETVIQMDGRVLARAIQPYLSNESGRLGGSLITTT
ncbi:hypothetical protein [Paenibacillus sp. sgz302251]|uniref:hypothetical protein n=1 Tax=Paenibacillus sp. sgz302251 TaxID=3414493 RepID=UPI003C7A06D1